MVRINTRKRRQVSSIWSDSRFEHQLRRRTRPGRPATKIKTTKRAKTTIRRVMKSKLLISNSRKTTSPAIAVVRKDIMLISVRRRMIFRRTSGQLRLQCNIGRRDLEIRANPRVSRRRLTTAAPGGIGEVSNATSTMFVVQEWETSVERKKRK